MLLAGLSRLLFVSRPADALHRAMIWNSFSFAFCERCYLSVFFVSCLSVSVKRQDTYIYIHWRWMHWKLDQFIVVRIHLHSVKKAVNEDWWYCCYFILHSKLDPYQDDLLYVRVINSLRGGFLRGFPRNTKHNCFYGWQNLHNSCVCCGYDETYVIPSPFFFSFFFFMATTKLTQLLFFISR